MFNNWVRLMITTFSVYWPSLYSIEMSFIFYPYLDTLLPSKDHKNETCPISPRIFTLFENNLLAILSLSIVKVLTIFHIFIKLAYVHFISLMSLGLYHIPIPIVLIIEQTINSNNRTLLVTHTLPP